MTFRNLVQWSVKFHTFFSNSKLSFLLIQKKTLVLRSNLNGTSLKIMWYLTPFTSLILYTYTYSIYKLFLKFTLTTHSFSVLQKNLFRIVPLTLRVKNSCYYLLFTNITFQSIVLCNMILIVYMCIVVRKPYFFTGTKNILYLRRNCNFSSSLYLCVFYRITSFRIKRFDSYWFS